MLDINLFRVDKGGNPDLIKESQKRRYSITNDSNENQIKEHHKMVEKVDEIINIDLIWRKSKYKLLKKRS